MNDFKKAAKVLRDSNHFSDLVVSYKNKTIKVRRGFFYRHGMDEEKWTDYVLNRIKSDPDLSEYKFRLIGNSEHWNSWPKDSFWEVILGVN